MSKEGPSSDPYIQGKLRAIEKERRVQSDKDLRDVLADPLGRRFVWRLLNDFCRFADVTLPGSGDEQVFRHEGRRAVAADLMGECNRVSRGMLAQGYVELMQHEDKVAVHKSAAEHNERAEKRAEENDDGE